MTASNSDLPPGATAGRTTARHGVPPELRSEVRVFGAILGQVVARVRRHRPVRRRRAAAPGAQRRPPRRGRRRAASGLVDALDLDQAEQVARAFTVLFHLVNLAEERHRVRVLRGRDRTGDRPDSLAGARRRARPRATPRTLARTRGPPGLHRAPDRGPPPRGRHRPSTGSRRLDRATTRGSATASVDAERRLREEISDAVAHRADPLDASSTRSTRSAPRWRSSTRRCSGSRRALPRDRARAGRRRRRHPPPHARRTSSSARGSAATATATRTSPPRSPARRWRSRPTTSCARSRTPPPGSGAA